MIYLLLLPLFSTASWDAWDGRRNALARAGDIDCDGAEDIAFARIAAAGAIGEVAIYSSATGEVLRVYTGEGPDDQFGNGLAWAGDVDEDGVDDLAIGALGEHRTGGYVQLRSGRTGELLRRFSEGTGWHAYGGALVAGGDLDGDGRPDLATSATQFRAGFVWVYSGATGETLVTWMGAPGGTGVLESGWLALGLLSLREEALRTPHDEALRSYFGRELCIGPDWNGDGASELVVTHPVEGWLESDASRAVREARTGWKGRGTRGNLFPRDTGSVSILSVPGREELVLLDHPPAQSRNSSGVLWATAAPGDIDGDGHIDLVATSLDSSLDAWSVRTGAPLWTVSLVESGNLHAIGSSLGVVSDIDGDGVRDLCLGGNESWSTDRGVARLLSSATGELLAERWPESRDGVDVLPWDDIDGDGLVEVVLAPRYEAVIEICSGRDLHPLIRILR